MVEVDLAHLPSRAFRPLRYGIGAWTEHVFFAYDLIAQLRPRLFVELGTDRGESYFACCQSVKENSLGTRCFAIDHWQGDSHAGSYDDTTFLDVEAHNEKHYASFSTLLRTSFDSAAGQFADASIDLLHLDGHHTEEAVRDDLALWLPKVRASGIILMHDVAVRDRGFGVWKVWEEMSAGGRAWTFTQPPGLGVWQKPPESPLPSLLEALFSRPNESRTAILDYYEERASALQEKIAQEWRDGSIRQTPLARETVVQVFWTNNGSFAEERSSESRIGHGSWKELEMPLPTDGPVTGFRIDFYSALTTIEIASISLGGKDSAYRVETPEEFAEISLGGDCVRLGCAPFRIQVTGIDPQLYLPAFAAISGPVLRMKLRVL